MEAGERELPRGRESVVPYAYARSLRLFTLDPVVVQGRLGARGR